MEVPINMTYHNCTLDKFNIINTRYQLRCMSKSYNSTFPMRIVLDDDRLVDVNFDDNRNRVLILEVGLDENTLRKIFSNNQFTNVGILEEKKLGQIGEGMRKKIDDNWDMHIRFFKYHQNFIAIDAEVETGTSYVDHLSHSENWVSVIKEIYIIIKSHSTDIRLYHKTYRKFVKDIISLGSTELVQSSFQTKWSELILVGVLSGIVASLGYLGAKEILRGLEDSFNEFDKFLDDIIDEFLNFFGLD
jgi:hypothetical protein